MQTCAHRAAAFAPAAAGAQRQQRQRQRQLVVTAGQGFASSQPKKAASSGSKKQPKLARYLGDEKQPLTPDAAAAAAAADGWVEIPGVDVETTFLSKPIKAVILATGRAVCIYKVGEKVYASDANSTAYKYPLADASILAIKGAPAVEVPLDGTVYDLATGKVLSWCPKNNLVRKVLGGLKDKSDAEDLPVYPVQVRGSKVFVNFTKSAAAAASS